MGVKQQIYIYVMYRELANFYRCCLFIYFCKGIIVYEKIKFGKGVSQSGPVDMLKRNGFLYGILIISIAGGHFL